MNTNPTFEATVVAELPQQLFRLEAADNHHGDQLVQLVAGPSEECKRLGIIVRTGQRVLARRASLDPGRGVILGLAR